MSYEIKDRYGKTLYVAKGATDVRQALQEAVAAGANLAGANLAGAYLAGAYLAGAYLAGANLAGANLAGANLAGANLAGANLAGANLAGANLARASLARANLAVANLARANLAGANLARANLAGANLADARGFNPARTNDLLLLNYQVGKIRAFKLVSKDGKSPIHSKRLKYEVGATVEVKNADTDPTKDCGAGINLATLPWVLRNASSDSRVLVCEFTRKDIACIPHASDGKFRVHRCTVVAELDLEREVFAHDAMPEGASK